MNRSEEIFSKSKTVIPGGVNSPVRSFNSVGGTPICIESAKGPFITDVDGKEYIDFCGSWGPMILGHANQNIVDEIQRAASKGISYGTNSPNEEVMAKLIVDAFSSIEKVRLTTSGTEATMTAVRLARGATKRNKIIKFEGCYHGHADPFLVAAGSGLLTNAISSSLGIPESSIQDTIVVPYNDIDSVSKAFEKYKNEIACVIVEPVAGNMGIIPPAKDFLSFLRTITLQNGSLLIFDEVITGFRLCYGGYQKIAHIEPDITTLGKIIGGGLPIGALGGKASIMDLLSPLGGVYQAGTLSGNPVALAAGVKTLEKLKDPSLYESLEITSKIFAEELRPTLVKAGYNIYQSGSMFCIYFQENIPTNLTEMKKCDIKKFNKFFHYLLNNGVYFSPSQFEANFISTAHTNDVLNKAIEIIKKGIANS